MMDCPTCSHTLARICTEAGTVEHYHCERCGTAVAEYPDGRRNVYAPKLVERCRAFEGGLRRPPGERHTADEIFGGLQTTWRTLGIAESIRAPADRPA